MTREIANWFHDRDEELFTVDETPFTRDGIVQVVDDSVDPVQQVMVEGEKYVGVISYDEHDGWYEYTRWDDSAGEVNMGVCAKCVEEAEYVDEVSRTIGDSTDVARQKFEKHYSDEHTVKPDEIETGATLLSGTTINGNEAIHPGMDGSGSSVDADFVLGNEALQTGSFFSFNEATAGTELSRFASPSSKHDGVGVASNDSIWYGDDGKNSIYIFNQSGVEQSKFSSPSNSPRGLGFDSNGSIWHADSASDSIYELNQSINTQSKFSSPSSNPYGLGVDSSNCIWNADNNGASIYRLNQSGTVEFQSASPKNFPNGLAIDSNDCVWVESDSIFKLDQSSNIKSKFTPPASQITGLGIDTTGNIWMANFNTDSIYEVAKQDFIQF